MYWKEHGIVTVNIPKTAHMSRRNVFLQLYSKYDSISDHFTTVVLADKLQKDMGLDYRKIEFWTVFRNPELRLLSAINYYGSQCSDLTSLLRTVRWEPDARAQKLFKPQHKWIDHPEIKVRIWPLERQDVMMRNLGWDQLLPYENRSQLKWTLEELRAEQTYRYFMNEYSRDVDLYQKALDNFADID